MVSPKSTPTTAASASGVTLTLDKPTAVSAGDVLIAFVRSQQTGGADVVPPSGWTRLSPAYVAGAGRVVAIFGKTATSVEPSTYSFIFEAGSRSVGIMSVWSQNDVALEKTGDSGDYRGTWVNDRESRGFTNYTTTKPSLSFIVGANELTDGIPLAPINPAEHHTMLASRQTGSGTSGSRTGIWAGYTESILFAPGDSIGWVSTAGDTVHGASIKLLDFDPPEPDPGYPHTVGTLESGTELIIERPTSVVSGDIMFAFIRSQATTPDVEAPSGWSRIGTPFNDNLGGRIMSTFMKVAGGSEPGLYTFTTRSRAVGIIKGYPPTVISPNVVGFAPSYRGVWDAGVGGRSSAAYSAPGDILQFVFAATETTDGYSKIPTRPPSGFTEIANEQTGSGNVGARTIMWVGTRLRKNNGSAALISFENAVGGDAIQSFAVQSLVAAPPPPTNAYDGHKDPCDIWITTSSSPIPGTIRPMRRGFLNTTEMLATPGFTWAHRGLSTFAEESLYSYTRAVERGHGLLEYSMGRTFDGVWVGTHDNNLNRATGRTDLPAINQMTWDEIQNLMITIGTDAPKPFSRVEEIIDAYGYSHMLMFDLKNYAWEQNLIDFLGLISSLPKERIMFKHQISADDHAAVVREAGYSRWGYFYANEYETKDIDALQAAWDFLGMEYNASQAIWDRTLDYGKPVIGHIASTQAHYDAAMSKGASGVQTTGYVVEPVSWWNT